MTKEHPQAAILRAIADGKTIQVHTLGGWEDSSLDQLAREVEADFRIKPETIVINGVECPKPIPAPCDSTNWIVRIEYGTAYTGQRTESSMLTFASEADARQVFDAVFKPFKEAE